MTVESSAPGKLILFGEHASSRGYPALVFAVNNRIKVTLDTSPTQGKILITSREYNIYKEEYPTSKLDIVTTTISTFFEKATYHQRPFELVIESDIRPGFGSSAAVIVAVLGALNHQFETNLTKLDLLKLAIDINLSIKGYGSGLDLATSIYGGLIKYQQNKKPEHLPSEKLNFIVGYTGVKAPSGPIVKTVRDFEKNNIRTANLLFSRIGEIVSEAEDAILASDFKKLGILMNENHSILKQLNVSSPVLEEMVTSALSRGALGAKLSGAGKGDNMIALVTDEKRDLVVNALNGTTGTSLPDIKIDELGLQVKNI
ncbi:MAG: mevalonate kinase [Candidatus Heimdallarchaeota archaeon]|nr:mevalonate kinase [Candidatus Heimdallarchaeota archaeon]